MKTVWCVVDLIGQVIAVFADEQDAKQHALRTRHCTVEERTVFYGQPPYEGFNL